MIRRRLRQTLGKGQGQGVDGPLHRTAAARAVFDRALNLAHLRSDKLRPVDLFEAILEWIAQAQHEGALAEFAGDLLARIKSPQGPEEEGRVRREAVIAPVKDMQKNRPSRHSVET